MNKFFNIILVLSLPLYANLTPIKLDNPLIKNLDGGLIDGSAILMQKQVLVSISNIVYGKQGQGLINYKNEKTTLQKLSIEERKLNALLKEKCGIDIKAAFHADVNTLPKEFQSDVTALQNAFLDAKQQFKDATFSFLGNIQHFKGPIVKLMNECCQKRKRTNSHILKWADASAGNEEALFHSIITTNNELNTFLYDILVFINDLSYSCPKATEQFKKYMQEKAGK